MILNLIFGSLALLSLVLTLWQWLVARRFPLHQRLSDPAGRASSRAWTSPENEARGDARPTAERVPSPLNPQLPLSLLKPLKDCDPATEDCLRSWFTQQYTGPTQILFGVAAADDPVCEIIRKLLCEFPASDAQLVVCGLALGANAKVSQLAQLEPLAKHDILIISDADVRVPPDFLANLIAPLSPPDLNPNLNPPSPLSPSEGQGAGVRSCGLVCCFYRLANPVTLAMRLEAIAINADFWSQVLQARSLKPMDFALGAVMALRRHPLAEIGGFQALADCLADDYQLGHRLARCGHRIGLCPVVVECWSAPLGWRAVWKHQLRWARTIRVCQPVPYFFSLLSNATLWPLLWLAIKPSPPACAFALVGCFVRVLTALNLQRRLNPPASVGRASPGAPFDNRPHPPALPPWRYAWLIPLKDLLQAALWLLAFLGNRIEWRGQPMRLRRDGTLERLKDTAG